ncbi:low molecular weight phosphotyrosine protein phosphatase [Arsenicicoccus piscis]|uniref:low molecular weight protein-tyrosine-phosphatase n=1 Tax=Arsenicicoccus piscis TaxID=673954 RepID=UPI001F4CB044|nr:low molecular weight protein-tyrosine-phosphatase [Arsenicicoccus piscis]MCH8626562.1 low molecular weight phosphotyrosine protein phosphatase [Arsenicicoccus piscis]
MSRERNHPLYRITVVCSGNICRSPIAEIVLRRRLEEAGLGDTVQVDSAGTGAWHVGDQADHRALAALTTGGYDGNSHRARQFEPGWFEQTDLVLAADRGHERQLRRLAGSEEDRAKVQLLRAFDPDAVAAGTLEVDDPYYGGPADFARTLSEVERAADGIVDHVRDAVTGPGGPAAGQPAR